MSESPDDNSASTGAGRRPDRLRELLDAVLDESADDLTGMADRAHSSRFHFARQVSNGAKESPVALRRRVDLERAAWGLRSGRSVTETAWEAGYDSVEGFARAYRRAYGHPPSDTPTGPVGRTGHWLPAPNGIHFHAPESLWITADPSSDQVTLLMAHHDLDDIRSLLLTAGELEPQEWTRTRYPGMLLLEWAGPEESIAVLLERAITQFEVWLASIEGREQPPTEPGNSSGGSATPSADDLLDRLDLIGPRWSSMLTDVEHRGAWGDRLVDALCDPPESFILGSIVAHVLTYNAQRRGLVRSTLRQEGVLPDGDEGDPIMWLRGGD